MTGDTAAHAAALHARAIVIDGHSDILMPLTDGKMRLGDRVETPDPLAWQPPAGIGGFGDPFNFPAHAMFYGPMGQYDLPRWGEGGVTAQLCAIYIEDHQLSWSLQRGLQMAWNLHHAIETNPDLELILTAQDIRRIKQVGTNGAILSLEGFDALGDDLRMLDLYYRLGLRVASLTHVRRNAYADGSYAAEQPGGLTALGKSAVRRMNELGIVVDLVHLHERGIWEVLEMTRAPLILSHSTSTTFPALEGDPCILGVPRPQLVPQRDRPLLEALAKNGGVLGIIWFYKADLDAVVADIEKALELMGEDHVGIGSDLFGQELAPRGLEHIGKMPALTQRLVERGHADEVILKILGGNFLRVFGQVWK